MIGTSFGELIEIRILICLFRYLPVLYIITFLYNVFLRETSTWYGTGNLILVALLLAEALFFILIYSPHKRRLNCAAEHPAPLSHIERRELFNSCLAHTPHLDEYLRWWFLGADLDDIRRGNLQEFFLWAFFDMEVKDGNVETVPQSVWTEVNEYVTLTESRLGYSLRDGYGSARSLRLTLDGISTHYRCLLWYCIVFIVDMTTHFLLSWYGFRYYARQSQEAWRTFPPRPQELFAKHRSPAAELSYWYLPHTDGSRRPIVFWHGIGIGLWTYAWFILELRSISASGEVGIIVPEMLPISFRLTDAPPRKDELLNMMANILDQHHSWKKFTLVSHSYGSIPTTHMLRSPSLRSRIESVILIDPVTILLHLPNVAYNFTRRIPKRANEWQLWYFASTDLGVAHCLGRHFFWRENILWKEDLIVDPGGGHNARRVAVCLSGRDLIVDTTAVSQYLTDCPEVINGLEASSQAKGRDRRDVDDVEVLVFPHLDHAQVFDRRKDFERVLQLIQRLG